MGTGLKTCPLLIYDADPKLAMRAAAQDRFDEFDLDGLSENRRIDCLLPAKRAPAELLARQAGLDKGAGAAL